MRMLYHRQPKKVIQALVGHKNPRSMDVYTRMLAATLAVPFTGDGRDTADIPRRPDFRFVLPFFPAHCIDLAVRLQHIRVFTEYRQVRLPRMFFHFLIPQTICAIRRMIASG
jgi:hypothetical protein